MQAAREAGIQNVDHLVTQAMLNPALARVLLSKVTPQNEASLWGALRSQLGRLSLVGAVQYQPEQPQRHEPVNALMQIPGAGPFAASRPVFRNTLLPLSGQGLGAYRPPGTVVMPEVGPHAVMP